MAPSDALIAFDVVDTLNSLADLAEQQGDHEALRHAVTTAIERLEVMDQKGQISGYSEHQSIRDSLRRRADQLKQPADLEVVAP